VILFGMFIAAQLLYDLKIFDCQEYAINGAKKLTLQFRQYISNMVDTGDTIREQYEAAAYNTSSQRLFDEGVASFSSYDLYNESSQKELEAFSNDLLQNPNIQNTNMFEFMRIREEEYKRRQKVLSGVCHKYHIGLNNTIYNDTTRINTQVNASMEYQELLKLNHFMMAKKYSALNCVLNKVASSSLVDAFLKLDLKIYVDGLHTPHGYVGQLNPKTAEEFQMANQTYFKFIVVRNPLDRLVSCYRDKMVKNRTEMIGWRMNVFVHWDSLNGIYLTAKEMSRTNYSELTPTFEQFLEFILYFDLTGAGFAQHWVPYWKYCAPCHVGYHAIAKLETKQEDFEYIWRRTGFADKMPVPWENKGIDFAKSTRDLRIAHFREIPKNLLQRIYNTYWLDFQMFGYSFEESLSEILL